MDAETSKRLVTKVIELCNKYFEENQRPVPDHWHDVFATEALLALLNEEIKKRKEMQ